MRVWMGIFGPEYWSIYGRRGIDVNDDYTLINRTNNPLERYNRTLGENFVHAHPTLPMLIQVLREEAERYVELLQNIEMGMTKPTPHEPLYIPEIPEEYYCWRSTKRKSTGNTETRTIRRQLTTLPESWTYATDEV